MVYKYGILLLWSTVQNVRKWSNMPIGIGKRMARFVQQRPACLLTPVSANMIVCRSPSCALYYSQTPSQGTSQNLTFLFLHQLTTSHTDTKQWSGLCFFDSMSKSISKFDTEQVHTVYNHFVKCGVDLRTNSKVVTLCLDYSPPSSNGNKVLF